MDPVFSKNNKYTTKIVPPSSTLGVTNELRRFAMNEYLDTKKEQILIGTDKGVVDDDAPVDDLLLTNAITENTVQDEIDKTRYIKETTSEVTINSAAREKPVTDKAQSSSSSSSVGFGSSLFTTGDTYYPLYPFAPYELVKDENGVNPLVIDGEYFVKISANNNHIQFKLQDITSPTVPIQQLNSMSNDTFDMYLEPRPTKYSLDELARAITINLNLVAFTAKPLDNLTPEAKMHMFTITAEYRPIIVPDRAVIRMSCQNNYQFEATFFAFGYIESVPIGQPISASDAAYVVQNPTIGTDATFQRVLPTIYPYPNYYALSLDKAYKNVKAIKIISSEIPNTDTIINTYNYHITIQLIDRTLPPPTDMNPTSQNIKTSTGSINWEIYIPIGNYDITQLATQIELIINNALFGEAHISDVFSISVSTITGAFDISTTDPYAFKWSFNPTAGLFWRNLYDMLGFRDSATGVYTTKFTNLITTSKGTTAPFKVPMLRKSNIIWLQLNNYETIYDTLTQNRYFCKFTLGHTHSGEFAIDTFNQGAQVFIDSPLAELTQIDVRFYDEVGQPYNFNGIDHSFTLEITHHIDRVMGVDISSRRGIGDKSSYI
jgi:hypothetical protein